MDSIIPTKKEIVQLATEMWEKDKQHGFPNPSIQKHFVQAMDKLIPIIQKAIEQELPKSIKVIYGNKHDKFKINYTINNKTIALADLLSNGTYILVSGQHQKYHEYDLNNTNQLQQLLQKLKTLPHTY